MLFEGLGKARKESDHNTPISGSLPAADLAMAVLTIAVIATLGVLLVVRVLDPQSIPGPGEMAMLGFVVIGALFPVRYLANHRK